MEWMNYHHLLYFWAVAREGGLVRASEKLHLAQSTVSSQIRTFEDVLGQKLFARSGRRLVLTEIGRMVYGYADAIFGLGQELQDALRDRPAGRPLRVSIGVADVVPKLVAWRLINPALRLSEPVRIVCHEDRPDRLLAELAQHELDLIITDAPANPQVAVRSFSHLLGESDIAFYGHPTMAARFRRGFPNSLEGAPLLLPTTNTVLRRSLEQWFEARRIRPQIVGEFQDSALLMVFGQGASGLFPVHSLIADDVARQYGVRLVGQVHGVRERFYGITVERRLKHPAVVAICDRARGKPSAEGTKADPPEA
jgi:LysR family transcriptional activator of nhaA